MPRRYSKKDIESIARERGGKLLSEHYTITNRKYRWECNEGHQWDTRASHVIGGSWCPRCAKNRRLILADLQEAALAKDGLCLEEIYKGVHVPHRFQCGSGHTWLATPSNILKGTWCPTCIGRNREITDCKKLAESFDGQCLAESIKNSVTPVWWECGAGHRFKASPTHVASKVRQGKNACPTCNQGFSERVCRTVFESIFGVEFPKTRKLAWLINQNGNRMELDGYSEELRVGFEHNGDQHYKAGHFMSLSRLKERQDDDQLKSQLCKKNSVKLVVVRQIPPNLEEAIQHIIDAIHAHGIDIPKSFRAVNIDWAQVNAANELKEIGLFVQNKYNGTCLSNLYVNAQSKLHFLCENGHKFDARPNSVRRGHWCPHCAKRAKGTLQDMQALAAAHNGKCLAKDYLGANTPLLWECENGHRFKSRPGNVSEGHWCGKCRGGLRDTVETFKKLARDKNGLCLSDEYVNQRQKLSFRCAAGHFFEAIAGGVKSGSWCPTCGGSAPLTIDDLRKTAQDRNGRLLSTKYTNVNANYLWACNVCGTEWEARAGNIRNGTWCPECARKASNDSIKKRRLTIESMQEIAQEKGGICTSTEYVNQSTKLTWVCGFGHEFTATPKKVKKGRWCPVCRGKLPSAE